MNVLIRTDASVEIGSGHVMRCLTIAQLLLERGHQVSFLMKPLLGNLIDFVRAKGFSVVDSISKVDLCIIDHYEVDVTWEKEARFFAKKIVVIDDLANRTHDCDVLLDQNVVPHYQSRYDDLVPEHCVKLLGPNYLMMREEFIEERKKLRIRTGTVNRILIFMGGTDPTHETMKVLNAIQQYNIFKHVDVVIGSGNPQKEEIQSICMKEGFYFHCQIEYIASLMGQADFSIGAGGSATWERCFVGLPSSSTIVAENQHISTETAAELEAIWNLGWHEQVTVDTYKDLLQSLELQKRKLKIMSNAGLKLTEQPGGVNSWLDIILEVAK